MSGVVLAVVQGQGKADLASGYELDIIAAAVVGGASLSGGRASVVGAVLGALIFDVAVLLIVVMDRIANRSAGLQARG